MPEPTYADPGYFERLYARDPDPWGFATSEYERDKYAATLDTLPPGRYTRAFEVGCSIGVFTRQLAASCDELLAVDVSALALRQAEERCMDQPWVRFAQMDLRHEWPGGSFDLIVFSEVLYYLGLDGIEAAAKHTLEALAPGGSVALVNWHGPTDGACTGDEAATMFIAQCRPRLTPAVQRRAEKYRLDVLK
jgi:SAM-dependent methyltransferase